MLTAFLPIEIKSLVKLRQKRGGELGCREQRHEVERRWLEWGIWGRVMAAYDTRCATISEIMFVFGRE